MKVEGAAFGASRGDAARDGRIGSLYGVQVGAARLSSSAARPLHAGASAVMTRSISHKSLHAQIGENQGTGGVGRRRPAHLAQQFLHGILEPREHQPFALARAPGEEILQRFEARAVEVVAFLQMGIGSSVCLSCHCSAGPLFVCGHN